MSLGGAGLPCGGVGVEQHDAEGRQDLRGGGAGELPSCHHQPGSLSPPQGENQAERGRAAAAARLSRQEVQLLDAAIGHGQHRLHPLTWLGGEHGGHQVASVCRSREDA